MHDFERLGVFYLGRPVDPATRAIRPEPLLYDAKDLTTHAVCVGMTGSGKTGLCVSLLEEAAIDGIPAIAIDPKGDIGNLALTFPDLRPDDFLPWIDPGEAARKGRTVAEHAAAVARTWRQGLADWDQDGDRITRLRDAAEVTIYTPGSDAGRPLRVLRSFAAPPAGSALGTDALRERVAGAASGLLTLLGVDADPIRSREHILLSTLLHHAWSRGRDLDVAALIREIQSPPVERFGVLDLETFYPADERFALSMRLNNLLASPGFASWMEGESLDVQRLLWTGDGRPRISVLSIAHLSDAERMFFVTLLLGEVLAWMRAQPGTSSLRAILYMDEIFGFFPPTANPPSKTPMLTLLKQARAYGLGVVLATQNPVDLDYKGLSNTGTWFLGRLQTERDKQRVLEGLEGAATTTGAPFDRGRMESTLAGLDSRVFLMNNVHEREPTLFHTRWALSYLGGPLTRAQIRNLSGPADERPHAAGPPAPPQAVTATPVGETERPLLPGGIREWFIRPDRPGSADDRVLYRPALVARAQLHFVRSAVDVDVWESLTLLADLDEGLGGSPWDGARVVDDARLDRTTIALPGAAFSALPPPATREQSYAKWSKMLVSWLVRERSLTVFECPDFRETSRPGEDEAAFRIRLQQVARERRDLEMEKLRSKYGPKLERLRDRIRRVEERIARERSQYGQQKLQTAISVGATVLGALFGRKVASAGTIGRAGTAMRGMGRTAREKDDVARASAELEVQQEKLGELEATFERELASIRDGGDASTVELRTIEVRPRKGDLGVEEIGLAWIPWRLRSDGLMEPLRPDLLAPSG